MFILPLMTILSSGIYKIEISVSSTFSFGLEIRKGGQDEDYGKMGLGLASDIHKWNRRKKE